eukprot:CAMPEP_0175336124 /NCGR_PEP_ID=MMETSP0095-20121207/3649_1 /TAXON_ID=311494 /ORGANISM="Alexandrium monilatum, Strain CCMP3105" /LENGTH=549 /DNA_ID=CAMNT_0016633469 /DNA_START=236 /DNA_END=1882 /DNA_ORIENTATION=-
MASMFYLFLVTTQTVGASLMVGVDIPPGSPLPALQQLAQMSLNLDALLRPNCSLPSALLWRFTQRILLPVWLLLLFVFTWVVVRVSPCVTTMNLYVTLNVYGGVFNTFFISIASLMVGMFQCRALLLCIFTWVVSRVSPCMTTMNLYVMFNVYGSVFNTFFITIASLMAGLFQCYQHPNGKYSVVAFPSLLCFEGEWIPMSAIAVCGLILFCVLPIAFFARIVWLIPTYFPNNKNFRLSIKFIVRKFTFDRAWWAIVLLLKGLWINLAKVFMTEATGQILWQVSGLLFYAVLTMQFMPWRHFVVSFVDVIAHSILTYFFTMQALFVRTSAGDRENVGAAAAGVLCVAFLVLAFGAGSLVRDHLRPARPSEVVLMANKLCQAFAHFAEQPERAAALLSLLPGNEKRTLWSAGLIIRRESSPEGLLLGSATVGDEVRLSRAGVSRWASAVHGEEARRQAADSRVPPSRAASDEGQAAEPPVGDVMEVVDGRSRHAKTTSTCVHARIFPGVRPPWPPRQRPGPADFGVHAPMRQELSTCPMRVCLRTRLRQR